MDEQEKRDYLESYKADKEHGIPFFPDALFKDAVVSLIIFLILVALAYFVGVPLEERANPADANYTPRPEWYFLFLFQLLKYFPGDYEVIGVVLIPTLAILGLFLLPFIDRSAKRHFLNRPIVTVVATLSILGILLLTYMSIIEAPPPALADVGDETAALYAQNCAGCHGPAENIPPSGNLHDVIAEGNHEGMPAWSADLTNDQIDALAGFILSPSGNTVFNESCSECHEVTELVASDPAELKKALDQGPDYAPHANVSVPDWNEEFEQGVRVALLNFLIAPDGQRLFETNCADCHGQSTSLDGNEADLQQVIAEGGLHLEMPPWQERLTDSEIDRLALYVYNPSAAPSAIPLFEEYCSECHGERVPEADLWREARDIIATGGAHETMPVWGEVLTDEQLDALVQYTLNAAGGTSLELGQRLYTENCVSCHGAFGEGGVNPARDGDIIAPISTAEYLQTRDDATLRSIISAGQPNFGMSPFGTAFGGPLDDDEIDAIVQFMRSWEANPPVELPPDVPASTVASNGVEIFAEVCAQCHDPLSTNFVGITLREPDFRENNSPEDIFDTINLGHEATPMIAWGEILTSDQISELVEFILSLPVQERVEASEVPADSDDVQEPPKPAIPSFALNILPLFDRRCNICHEEGGDGGWNGSNYEAVMTSGDNAPVIIPGDTENSLLALKLLDLQTEGDKMPPKRDLTEDEIQLVLDWIAAGAPNN
jgi:mono/diheme cytochrome c family protein